MASRLKILASYLKVDEQTIEYLGSGNFAEAFLYNGRVYKITRDIDDYLMANRLIKEGRKFDCFVKVYKTRILKVTDNFDTKELYLIVSEYVTPLDKSDNREAHNIWNQLANYNDSRDYLTGNQSCVFPQFLTKCPLSEHLFNEMVRILKIYKKLGMQCWDNYPRNLAYIEGKIKIFDFGYSALKPQGEYKYSKRRTVIFNFKKEFPVKPKEEQYPIKNAFYFISNEGMIMDFKGFNQLFKF